MRPKASQSAASGPTVDAHPARSASVQGSSVHRALPHPRRRTVGAWCFVDHFGPGTVPAGSRGMDVGPHPHCGLATVTWLFDGHILHRDSLGSVQEIRPGQLNWMSAGRGISHAEEGRVSAHDQVVHGVQMWVAQPSSTRDGPARFEHYAALPHIIESGLSLRVLVGSFRGELSPAKADSPLFGLDIQLDDTLRELPVDPDFESAVVVIEGEVEVEGTAVTPGHLCYLGMDRETVSMRASSHARLMWIGGAPLDEALLMGWNFVVRDADELEAAFASWRDDDGRFGSVSGARADRIPAPER